MMPGPCPPADRAVRLDLQTWGCMPSLWGGLATLGRGRPVLDESLIARHGEYERNRQALQHLVRRWRLRPQLLVAIAQMETRIWTRVRICLYVLSRVTCAG